MRQERKISGSVPSARVQRIWYTYLRYRRVLDRWLSRCANGKSPDLSDAMYVRMMQLKRRHLELSAHYRRDWSGHDWIEQRIDRYVNEWHRRKTRKRVV